MASVVAAWPMVALGEVLRKSENWVDIASDREYAQITVRLWGKGVALRGRVLGAEIAASRQVEVRQKQFILSRIDARNGAFGLVPPELDGAVVSTDFPVFDLDMSRILPTFLAWISKTHDFVELCKQASEGTTNRVRLKEERFLATEILLPPLDEQRRIVARIEELAARIEEARGLRREAVAEAEALWKSTLADAFMTQGEIQAGVSAGELLRQQAAKYVTTERPNYNGAYPWAPRVYEEGLFPIPSSWVWTDLGSVLSHFVDCVNDTPNFTSETTGFLGLKSSNIRPYRLDLTERWFVTEEDYARWNRRAAPQPGDLILTREAPMGNVCMLPEGVTACLTQRLMLLRSDVEFVDASYLLHFLNSSHFQSQVLEQCRGLTTPHIRVKDAPFLKLPLPPRRIQSDIVAYLDNTRTQLDGLRRLQQESDVELDALLPSVLDKAFRGEL